MEKVIDALPSWFGTAPQWATLAVIIVALIKTWPVIMLRVTEAKSISWKQKREERTDLIEEVERLRKAVTDCQKECARESEKLREALFSQRKQHIQEQLSLINVILRTVESEELRGLLKTLESVQSTIALQTIMSEGAEKDGKEQRNVEGA